MNRQSFRLSSLSLKTRVRKTHGAKQSRAGNDECVLTAGRGSAGYHLRFNFICWKLNEFPGQNHGAILIDTLIGVFKHEDNRRSAAATVTATGFAASGTKAEITQDANTVQAWREFPMVFAIIASFLLLYWRIAGCLSALRQNVQLAALIFAKLTESGFLRTVRFPAR